MVSFCVAIKRDSVSLLMFTFLSNIQIFSYEISLVCRLCFPFYFCLQAIVVLLIFMLHVLFLVAIISFLKIFLMLSSSPAIDVSTLFSMLASHLPASVLDSYSLSMLSLGWKALFIVLLVFLFSRKFVEVLPTSISRMIPSILLEGIYLLICLFVF